MSKITLGFFKVTAFIMASFGMIAFALFALFWYALLVSFLIEPLWNHILVPLTHVGIIGYWQSVGLYMLTGILIRVTNKVEIEKPKKFGDK